MGLNGPRPDDLLAALDALADAEEAPPPAALRARVLAAARDERPPGMSVHVGEPESAIAAFRSQVEAVRSLAHSLEADDWDRHAEPYPWTLHDLLGHLVGVEGYLGSVLGLWSFDLTAPESDHVALTVAEIARQRTATPVETLAEWETRVDAIVAHVEAQGPEYLAAEVAFHTYPFSVGSALVARSFELWIHADDLRRALGRPTEVPAPGVLHQMADLSVRNLLAATLVTAPHQFERSARVVLTGPGGGTWHLGDVHGTPDVTVVTDVVDYCRMVARRVEPPELDAQIAGDAQLALDLFEAAQLLAA
jgi:uncharacterized protein (TIGR03083 family)